MEFEEWRARFPQPEFSEWLEHRCFARRSACATPRGILAYLDGHELPISGETLRKWRQDSGWPDAFNLLQLFDMFVIDDVERRFVALLVVEKRAAASSRKQGAA